jgi:hypothetical protein
MRECALADTRKVPLSLGARSLVWLASGALLATVVCGCAPRVMRRVDVQFPSNPPSGTAIRIGEVKDRRVLEDVSDVEFLRPRLVGAHGDRALLPEGTTVEELAGKLAAAGFQRAGYRVLKGGDAGYEGAAPIDVDVEDFWMSGEGGGAFFRLYMKASFRLKGPLAVLEDDPRIDSSRSIGAYYSPIVRPFGSPSLAAWEQSLAEGSEGIIESISRHLTRAAEWGDE